MERLTQDRTFQQRFERREAELKWLYMELYQNDAEAWRYFRGMLRRMWEARSADLKALDAAREQDPAWYKGHAMLGMLMYVGTFAGTLRGVREKLDYIEECAVNYLHLMPLLESPAGRSDGGYAVSDFRRVQPELGTMEDLAALAADCHRRGISLCLDFVMNHTSEDHAWAKAARAGVREKQDRDFIFVYHNCSNAIEKKVDAVISTGARMFHFGEKADMWALLNAMPRDVIVMGNISPSAVFLCDSTDKMAKDTQYLLRKCMVFENFMISSGCDIPANTPLENIDKFFEVINLGYHKARLWGQISRAYPHNPENKAF